MAKMTEKNELSAIFGEVLRDLRKENKLTLRKLSEISGVALGYVSEVERGVKDVSGKVLIRLVESLDTTLIHFLLLAVEKEKQKTR